MKVKSKATKKKENKNYRSRYDANRPCYRKDKTHYVYMQWVEPDEDGEGYYIEHVFTVGEAGVTIELLDYLQASDNGEVQDQEDDERSKKMLAESIPTHVKSREEELCSDEVEHMSPELKAFYEKVRPHLTDEQMDLIYDRYGMGMTPGEIAAKLPPNEDGSPKTHQAVSSRLNCIFDKVKKYMLQE